jgi:hypothetical protein
MTEPRYDITTRRYRVFAMDRDTAITRAAEMAADDGLLVWDVASVRRVRNDAGIYDVTFRIAEYK